MPPFVLPFAMLYAFFKEVWLALKAPQYRSLLFWIMFILLTGTIVYHRVEGWSWTDSFYFCVVTLATVGYGDLVPEQPIAKIFTTVYILIGLGFLATFVNLLAKKDGCNFTLNDLVRRTSLTC
jgi:hypothetical protein